MDHQKFEALVERLEETARRSPGRYLVSSIMVALLGVGILGVVIGAALLSLAAMAGLVFLAFFWGGSVLIVLAKLGKLVFVLALPAWVMLKSTFTLLFSRFPAPEGRPLLPSEAPKLFERLHEIRQRVGGPPIHAVLLTRQLNAAIVQHPRFGLFGWERNYLILGTTLLQTLSEPEAFAVVAHEYGHLSGHHSRLGGFIYRLRAAWGRLQALSESWTDWGSRLVARLFHWYAPYFNAYTFVLARRNEYLADRTSSELAGVSAASLALVRTSVAALHESEGFWPAINRRTVTEADPPEDLSSLWSRSLTNDLTPALRQNYLDAARKTSTNHLDTHPALTDRLQALGVAIDESAVAQLEPLVETASKVWLGESARRIEEEFDREWSASVAQQWRDRHAHMKEKSERLDALESLETQSDEECWEAIALTEEVRPDEPVLPKIQALLDRAPDHLPALFRRGSLRLAAGDVSGIDDIESVMARDSGAILPGCEAAWRFYSNQDEPERSKGEAYAVRWRERSAYVEAVQSELATLPGDAVLEPETSEELRDAVAAIVRRSSSNIRVAFLLRRTLRADPNVSDHVLAFETSRFTLGNKGPEVVKRLVGKEFPTSLFVVHLGGAVAKNFRKQISAKKAVPVFKA